MKKAIAINVNKATADRFNRLHLAGANKSNTYNEFARVIFNIGLAKYEKSILPVEGEIDLYKNWLKLNDEIREAKKKLKLSAHEAPETIHHTQPKIIPFPGVVLKQEDELQNAIDEFLKEMGYVE